MELSNIATKVLRVVIAYDTLSHLLFIPRSILSCHKLEHIIYSEKSRTYKKQQDARN